MRIAIALLLTASFAGSARAQKFDLYRSGLPRHAANHVQSIVDDSATRRFSGASRVDAGETIASAVLIRNGELTIAGQLRGELVALRGDVVFEPGAVVDGDVTVVDGSIRGEENARITGTVTVYGEGFDLVERAERFHDSPRWRVGERSWKFGDDGGAELAVHVAENYNRVEGMPVQIGPEVSTSGRNRLRLEALAVWRTDVGPITETRRMGYVAQADQYFGGGAFRIGAGARSTVHAIESWNLTNLEASLAAALFHEDQRDYFERTGWSAHLGFSPRSVPLDVVVEYRDEKHASLAVRDVWTLFNDERPWRAQPLIAEGSLRAVHGTIDWDERRGDAFSTHGWLARVEVTRTLNGTLQVPVAAMSNGAADPVEFATPFTTGLIDVRRYQRAGRTGVLGIRAVAGGALTEQALPPQYQLALGGAGSLPGYTLYHADCGARSAAVRRAGDAPDGSTFFPSYGCDRMALLQVEFRGGFGLDFRSDDDHRGWNHDADFDWAFFFDAGRGWALQQDRFIGRGDTRQLYDIGAGIILGGLGIYGAVPLDGEDRGVRVFVRLGPRF